MMPRDQGEGLGHPREDPHGHEEMRAVGLDDPTLLQTRYQSSCVNKTDGCAEPEAPSPVTF